jgi:hypothetical protein
MQVLGGLKVAVAVEHVEDEGDTVRRSATALGAAVDAFLLADTDVVVADSARSSVLKVRVTGLLCSCWAVSNYIQPLPLQDLARASMVKPVVLPSWLAACRHAQQKASRRVPLCPVLHA